jgi:hypothetical protein
MPARRRSPASRSPRAPRALVARPFKPNVTATVKDKGPGGVTITRRIKY